MNKTVIKNALILFAFTVVLGFLLGLAYTVTLPKITENNEKTAQAAYQAVFKDADHFKTCDFDAQKAADFMTESRYKDQIKGVQMALDANEQCLGYVITVIAKDGSQGSITFSVGITNDGVVNGYSITDIAETPGLGMKATEESFYSQFENKQVSKFTVVKTESTQDSEIEAISGSTITSKAIANGCNAAMDYFKTYLKGGN